MYIHALRLVHCNVLRLSISSHFMPAKYSQDFSGAHLQIRLVFGYVLSRHTLFTVYCTVLCDCISFALLICYGHPFILIVMDELTSLLNSTFC